MRIGEKDGLDCSNWQKLLCKYAEEGERTKKSSLKMSSSTSEWKKFLIRSLSVSVLSLRHHHRIYLKCFEKENFPC